MFNQFIIISFFLITMSLAYKLPLSSIRRCYSSTRLCASNMVKELLVICGPSGKLYINYVLTGTYLSTHRSWKRYYY